MALTRATLETLTDGLYADGQGAGAITPADHRSAWDAAIQASVFHDDFAPITVSGTNTYTATVSPFGTDAKNRIMLFKFTNANTTAATLAINGGSAIAIKKNVNVALVAGDIAAGGVYMLAYDGTNFQMLGKQGTITGADGAQILGINRVPVTGIDLSGATSSVAMIRITQTGTSTATFDLTRSGGTASQWQMYLPTGSTNLRFYDGTSDRAILTTAGLWQVASLQATGLTSGRIPIVSTSGLLADDSDLTFSGSTTTMTNAVVSTLLTATTALNVGGNATAAGILRIYEDTDAGTNFSAFTVGTQSGDITYTLPTALPALSGNVLASTTGGVMSWTADLQNSTGFSMGVTGTSLISVTASGAFHTLLTAATNTVEDQLTLIRSTSGTAAAGIGIRLLFQIEHSGGGSESAGSIEVLYTDATDTSEDSDMTFNLRAAGAAVSEKFRFSSDGAFYIGPSATNGSWRFIQSGDDLLIQQREAGTYVTKSTISGA